MNFMIDRLKLNSFAVELRHEWEINSLSPVNLLNTVLSRMPNLTILYYPMSDNTSGMCVKDIYDSSLELNIPNLNDLNADTNPGSEFSNLKDSDLNEDSSTDSDFESKISSDMLIGINSNMSIGRQNFTLAHELYHLLYEENKNNFVICDYSSESELSNTIKSVTWRCCSGLSNRILSLKRKAWNSRM